MVATLPSHLQRPFHQAKALYRFLANPRVGAEALLERVCRESALALEGEEVLVFLDLSPVRKPHARALEGIARVGRKREAGYELLTALGMDAQGRLALGYAHLVAYGAGFCQPAPGGGAGHCGAGRRSGSALEGLLLRLEGKPWIAGERDGPYLLLQGLVRLLNYEVTKEALEEEEGSFG
jgi:hypothetical protein